MNGMMVGEETTDEELEEDGAEDDVGAEEEA